MLLRLHLLALVCSLAACTGEVGSDGATLGDPTLDDLRHCGKNPRHPCPPDAMTAPDAAMPPDAAITPDAAPPPPDAAPPDAAPPDAADCISAAGLPTPSDGHHNAGADCLGCHAGLGSSLRWTVAGTLYTNASGSSPVSQATIQAVDARGLTVNIATATNGNFWTLSPVTFPLHVKASKCPSTAIMSSSVSSGSCNSCHGSGSRIHLP